MERADTIAAISTPHGAGGIAVIRISGPDARAILESCFKPARNGFPSPMRDMSFGKVHSGDGRPIDDAIGLFFEGPSSYTGEDVAEIQCHGGTAVARAVLSEVISHGARGAMAGEFTRRALMNGKMSLIKAEATLAIIKARTEKGRSMASELMSGSYQREASALRSKIIDLLARIEARLDWPDELIDEESETIDANAIASLEETVSLMIEEQSRGRLLIDGLKVAIIGRPNMGKSSLLNRILGADRAMVSEIPGTTRDTVEETANIEGIPIRFADTAGIGSTGDPLIEAGVQRAKKAALSSAVVVYVSAFPDGLTEEDMREIGKLQGKPIVVALNKSDLKARADDKKLQELGKREVQGHRIIEISAKTGFGMQELFSAIAEKAASIDDIEQEEGSSSRWIACLESCLASLKSARATIASQMPAELACTDLRDAAFAMGELIGDVTSEDVLDAVFEKFCIGK